MNGGKKDLDLGQFQAALSVHGRDFAEALFRKLDAGESLCFCKPGHHCGTSQRHMHAKYFGSRHASALSAAAE